MFVLRYGAAAVASGLPHGYHIEALHGFVEELVVNDDPEHQWIDKIRSMRASNEARQMQFSKLSGNLLLRTLWNKKNQGLGTYGSGGQPLPPQKKF